MELSASAQGDARIVAARSLPRSVAHLDRAVLFQIFDYLRDALAFLQCEATCVDFRSLLREDGDTIGQIGQKLWQARPIAYGARIFATGGTAYTEEELEDLDEQYWAGTVGWTERHNDEICDGGREVVLGFACMDAIGAAQRLHGAIIAPLAGEQWTPLLNRLHRWSNLSIQRPLDMFSSAVVLAATESVEAWIIDLMEKGWLCALHRGKMIVTGNDIKLAARCSDDLTARGTEFPGCASWKSNAIYKSLNESGDRPLAELLAELDGPTQERIIRTLARRAGFAAYDNSAYETLWRLVLLRLCVLLERVDAVYFNTTPEDWEIRFPTPESWKRSKHRPSLETLAYVLQNGSGPMTPPPPHQYAPFRDEDDGSFRSDDCSDTDDDDDSSIGGGSVHENDSSIGDESAQPSSVADRLASLASLRSSGALTEAEFARAKALELGLPVP
ncbi:unnamed protein product [Pelagomonas calceolata]|uniref:Uncharacterized protein n=1 Tax=Pelagomonas calceolata TaxID=35677 RepID=A0A7S4A724_9STRA|nr:unnamed protein product [Pelagomonas calceolata]|mmetsp:Transcript_16824/g.52524  ORF Transcript_16824/g.52524 Transcript_16824/m.52524 type:complete len:445 (+) Transcript_16824:129-1463(+)